MNQKHKFPMARLHLAVSTATELQVEDISNTCMVFSFML